MSYLSLRFKKTLLMSCMALNTLFFFPAEAKAAACVAPSGTLTEQYLYCIRQYTNETLAAVNTLPDYIKAATAYFLSWTSTDETKESTVPEMQSQFTTLTNEYTKNTDFQKKLQSKVVTSYFKNPADPTGATAITAVQLPNANDLAYQTLLDMPYFKSDPRKDSSVDPSFNYMSNAAALNVLHPLPNPNWKPKEPIQLQRYYSYYNTLSAVQTYNAYILSELYANKTNKFKLSDTQKQLVDLASGSDWLKQVGSDNLGLTLRHLLLFDSQIFVLLTHMLDVQKQMLTTQAMTNSLLVILNMGNEDMLVKKADGSFSLSI
jgi:hypothetical protein